jgi:hypothetical protein
VLFSELWEEINGISPIRINLPITASLSTKGTNGAKVGEKINLPG